MPRCFDKDGKPVNKAQLIRDYLADGKKPEDIVEIMCARGLKIAATYVATVQYHGRMQERNKRRGNPTMSDLLAAQAVVDNLGGIAAVKHALAVSREFVETAGDFDRAEKVLAALTKMITDSDPAPVPALVHANGHNGQKVEPKKSKR